MTIKRRLFRSNILMIVLPILLTGVMMLILYAILIGISGVSLRDHRQGSLTVLEPSAAATLLQTGDYTQVTVDVSVYQSDTGAYVLVLPEQMSHMGQRPLASLSHSTLRILFLIPLVLIFLTNRFLTRRISNHITASLDTLVDGVREIRDGNLQYRIRHDMGNEFDTVCADFNEMASRLSAMVEQRQADEKNRRELIAGISHDLRTPLTSIKAYIEGIKQGVAATPEMQEKYFDTIQSKTEDIAYIIDQLFVFSKADMGEFPLQLETVDMGEELDKLVAGLADEYEARGLRLSLLENAEGVPVSLDLVPFRNIVQNILDNSVKYGDQEKGNVEFVCRRQDDRVAITITDNGPGVSEEMLANIFDVFYRGDSARTNPSQGSGLGLAISAKIIERLQGTIRAENAPAGGLRIIITLPIRKEESL